MEETVILEWSYHPPDFFEEPITGTETDFELKIDKGKIEAKVKAGYFDSHPDIHEQLENKLKSIFLGVQLLSHKQFSFTEHKESRLIPNGSINVTIQLQVAEQAQAVDNIDIISYDKDRNIIGDTKRDRINHQRLLAGLIDNNIPTDPLVRKLLDSQTKSIEEPTNELTYLYEILEAIRNRFDNEKNAQIILGVSEASWRKFRILANVAPIRQGRHRGLHLNLRDATQEELQEARGFALSLIEKYLQYLETLHP